MQETSKKLVQIISRSNTRKEKKVQIEIFEQKKKGTSERGDQYIVSYQMKY